MSIKLAICISVGAAIGALLRYFISLKCNHFFPALPLGTLIVNLSGCFFMGMMGYLMMNFIDISPAVSIGITSGLLGSFTTFSTFAIQNFSLILKKEYAYVALHISAHVIGSIVFVFVGFFFMKYFHYLLGGS